MILHYLSLAWQQLEKYRLQSLVSIVSLAIGFACFALASMWIKYEMTYDAFHKDADRMYCLIRERDAETTDWQMEGAFCDSVIKYCHEVEATTPFLNGYEWDLRQNGKFLATIEYTSCDSSFLEMFNIQILAGTDGFLHNDREVAINRLTAEKLWPDQNPLGQEFTLDGGTEESTVPYKVTAVVDGWEDEHSCLHFDLLVNNTSKKNYNPFKGYDIPYSPSFEHVLRLSPHADVDEINARLDSLDFCGNRKKEPAQPNALKLLPLDQLRHTLYQAAMSVKVNHLYLFALAGSLLILCGLLNYLTMFINRLFIRQREIALRTVFGATKRDLILQFLIEYGLVLFIALLLGIFVIDAVREQFCQMAKLPKDIEFVYREGIIYMLWVGGVSLLISLPVIGFFRRQALHNSIQSKVGLFSYSNFRKLSVCIQMCISILFIFCTALFQKQIHTLRNDDFGFERNNIGLIQTYDLTEDEIESFASYLRQQPEVVKLIRRKNSLFPNSRGEMIAVGGAYEPNRDKILKETVNLQYFIDKEYALPEFYGLKLLKGRFLGEEDDPMAIVVNETTVKKFNWDDPIGQQIEFSSDVILYVVGVVKDFCNMGPLTPPHPTFICKEVSWNQSYNPGTMLIFKYQGEDWKTLKNKYEEYVKRYEGGDFYFEDAEEEFDAYLESELNLQKLLNIITGVCILIALFGVWSMIMLTCEQRRREIAIRKVFGATTKDILDMFFIEYMSLQGIAALVAFPIGYACMKPWLEQYVVQTEISWWIYVGIFLMVALLVALCVGWRVWKTANARPADEIK